jgi:hypothetical protein
VVLAAPQPFFPMLCRVVGCRRVGSIPKEVVGIWVLCPVSPLEDRTQAAAPHRFVAGAVRAAGAGMPRYVWRRRRSDLGDDWGGN